MIVITSHQKPDFDAVASMVAVQKLFPDSIVVIAGVPEENVAKFLNAFPQVFSFQSDDSFNPFDIDNAIVVDTQCLPSTGKFIELIQSDAYELHVYDHHPLKKHSGKKPAVFVHENVGATVTILIKRLIAEGINIRPEEATLMLLAIYEETGSFRYVSSTPDDLEAAAALLRFGADIALVADYFSQQLDLEHTRVLSQLLDSLEYIQIQSIKIYFVTASLNYFLPNVSFLLHKIRELENIGILFSFIEMAGKVYFIARSNHQFIDVGAIAEYFGGGGHPTAASAVLRDKPLAQIKDEVIAYLNAAVKKEYTASDIMSYPVKFITEDTSVEHAKQTMVKANFNTLPVLKQGKLAGIVTRKDLDKALFHQFANSPVKLYMNTDVVTIKSDTPLSEIREKFRENNIGRLPVVDEDVLRGIITRTDLFRILHDDYLSDRGGLRETSFRQYPFSKISHKQFDKVLPKEILSLLQTIGTLADDYGFQAYVVGGFVRDVLLGYKNFDIDIVVERDGIAFAQIIANHFSARYVVHQKFATAVVALPDGLHIDIATARLEYYASPGALPTIELASIKQDLARRDFSINAMAIKINASEF
ncbi:CBS domain-containing protein, partial [bacterium]|nr:CBS domain-containing protein [bacterium]